MRLRKRASEVDGCDLKNEEFNPVMSGAQRLYSHDPDSHETQISPRLQRL
jgi:hypothetical protein